MNNPVCNGTGCDAAQGSHICPAWLEATEFVCACGHPLALHEWSDVDEDGVFRVAVFAATAEDAQAFDDFQATAHDIVCDYEDERALVPHGLCRKSVAA